MAYARKTYSIVECSACRKAIAKKALLLVTGNQLLCFLNLRIYQKSIKFRLFGYSLSKRVLRNENTEKGNCEMRDRKSDLIAINLSTYCTEKSFNDALRRRA